MFSILFENQKEIYAESIAPSRDRTLKADAKAENICREGVYAYLKKHKLAPENLDKKNKELEAVFQTAITLIAGHYETKRAHYLAQLYVYATTLDPSIKQRRHQKIEAICNEYFHTPNYSNAVQSYINSYSFSIPDEGLEKFIRNTCGDFLYCASRENGLDALDNSKARFIRTGNNKKLAMTEFDARWQYLGSVLNLLTLRINWNKDLNAEDILTLHKTVVKWSIVFTKERAKAFIIKCATNYAYFLIMREYIEKHPPSKDLDFMVIHDYYLELFDRLCSKLGQLNLEKVSRLVLIKLDSKNNSVILNECYPSIFRSFGEDLFEGDTFAESKNCLLKLLKTQNKSALDQLKLVTKELGKAKYTAETLYNALTQQQIEKNEKKEHKLDTSKKELLLQAGGESDALLEEILADRPDQLSPDDSSQNEANDLKLNDPDDVKPAPMKKKPRPASRPTKKTQKCDPNKVYRSPMEHKQALTKPSKLSPEETKNDTSKSPAPREDGKDILVSVGVLRGIEFRLDELKSTASRLREAVVVGDSNLKKLARLRHDTKTQLDILTQETDASEWKLADIQSKLLICDELLHDAGIFLKNRQIERSNLDKFDDALWKLIWKEDLVSGKGWGGTIDKKLGGKFEKIEALYHGLSFDPKKEVTIDGKKRKLKVNETLVFYVTQSSTTEDIFYCISIKLWNLRGANDPTPRRNSRICDVGELVPQIHRIDVDNWKCTGKNMAVLHVR